jgi:hypothetical protein
MLALALDTNAVHIVSVTRNVAITHSQRTHKQPLAFYLIGHVDLMLFNL